MPETELILLVAAVLLLCLLVWQTGGIRSRLSQIEIRLTKFQKSTVDNDGDEAAMAETSSGGAFESFLAEDPSRSALTKAEQFAAYRKWRKDKRLNWEGS